MKDCEHRSLTIEGKFVQESVKVLRLDLKNQRHGSDSQYFLYFFDGGSITRGERRACAAEVKRHGGDIVHMSGELYNAEDEEDRPRPSRPSRNPTNGRGRRRGQFSPED